MRRWIDRWGRFVLAFGLAVALGFCAGAQAGRQWEIVAPGEATPEELQRAIQELVELMENANRSQEQIDEAIRALRCAQNPEEENCEGVEGGQGQNEKGEGFERR